MNSNMNYRRLGKTNLMVSEIGLGAEWLERHNTAECLAIVQRCQELGINILDCWMSNPEVRSNLGLALEKNREHWYIQGHLGSTWQDGQYVRTRELSLVKEFFEDLLTRLKTDYIDLGMLHYVDMEKDWLYITEGSPYLDYAKELQAKGVIKHLGLSTHNPRIAKKAVTSGLVEMILFSINPAFDLMPPSENLDDLFAEEYDASLGGINKERAELYSLCQQYDVGITVMKPFAGGRLFDAKRSAFGVALSPIQCIHYCLTRPAVASVLGGYDSTAQVEAAVAYEKATDAEKDYAEILAKAPKHSFGKQCTYCGHCKPCLVNIDIAMVNKLYDLAIIQEDGVPDSIKGHYNNLEVKASSCTGCKSCESRCPFGVPIAENMKKTAALLG